MIVYGFAKDYQYDNDGTLKIQVRIPSIHGPWKQVNTAKGTYTRDEDLPWITSILLPHLPTMGEVVMLSSVEETNSSEFVVIGLTGGSYYTGSTAE